MVRGLLFFFMPTLFDPEKRSFEACLAKGKKEEKSQDLYICAGIACLVRKVKIHLRLRPPFLLHPLCIHIGRLPISWPPYHLRRKRKRERELGFGKSCRARRVIGTRGSRKGQISTARRCRPMLLRRHIRRISLVTHETPLVWVSC